MLFSEPKIPQFQADRFPLRALKGFSALQRAENSSIVRCCRTSRNSLRVSVLFSEPKIPQSSHDRDRKTGAFPFQCSSASRKFLNRSRNASPPSRRCRFQCSSASRKFLNYGQVNDRLVHVLFQCSSASRKFLNRQVRRSSTVRVYRFSALQRAENSSIDGTGAWVEGLLTFQCSSASRKFLNHAHASGAMPAPPFQCSSASRKFLNRAAPARRARSVRRTCSQTGISAISAR